jgi:hypothetical protein
LLGSAGTVGLIAVLATLGLCHRSFSDAVGGGVCWVSRVLAAGVAKRSVSELG